MRLVSRGKAALVATTEVLEHQLDRELHIEERAFDEGSDHSTACRSPAKRAG